MRAVIVAGLLAAIVMVASLVVTQVVDFRFFDLQIRVFNADKHDSLFGIVSLLAQVAVAVVSLRRARVEPRRRAWRTLGALVGVLVVIRGLLVFNAALLAVPLACIFGLLCWLTWRDPGAARGVVWAGLILMGTSLVLHQVGLASDAGAANESTWAYQIISIIKHGAELAGWTLLATGIVAGVEGRTPREVGPAYVEPFAV